ncbi:MAG: NYN domain-containing protein [Nitrospirae bacterium]|nr:NYN domain-containing protein [Nitrospirota bacterium]
MAYILIDGYNLIGTAHRSLESARNDLIQRLQAYASLKGHDITLVFDGHKSGQLNETRIKGGLITVIFSRLGENADSVIKKMLSASARHWIVVSSDREIADFAERKGFASIASGDFERRLYSLHAEETEPEDTGKDDDIEAPVRQKGNPRMLSKRQKEKLRALKKL